MSDDEFYGEPKHANLELINWTETNLWNDLEKIPVKSDYKTFSELTDAMDELGSLRIETDRVSLYFVRTSGKFGEHVIVLRASGLNVSRILLTKERFEAWDGIGDCVNRLMANDLVGPEIEYSHLAWLATEIGVEDGSKIDETKYYSRLDIDVAAAMRKLDYRDQLISEDPEGADEINFLFDLGFAAGRSFSAAQNLETLEGNARKGFQYQEEYKKRGKKSGSDLRRLERLEQFLCEVERVFDANEAFREHEQMVLKVAFDKIIPEGSYGHGQFSSYCTALSSEQPFKSRFDAMFRNSVK